jgi:hypothetical protein
MGGNGLIGVLVNWFPMLLLVAVWLLIFRRSRDVYTGKSGKTHGEMLEEHIAELRRQNDLLEKLVKDQEARLQRVEARRNSALAASGASASSAAGSGGSGR